MKTWTTYDNMLLAPRGWQEMDQPDGSPQGRLRSGHADPKATPAAWMPWQGGFS